jgi:hypothetical protein
MGMGVKQCMNSFHYLGCLLGISSIYLVVFEFRNSTMITLSELKAKSLDLWFKISFDSGVVVEAVM